MVFELWTKQSKTPIHFPEAELIFPVMFRNFIDGSQNPVWCLRLERETPQNYENRSSLKPRSARKSQRVVKRKFLRKASHEENKQLQEALIHGF